MQHEGLACRPAPVWGKAGQPGGPGRETTLLTFPTAGARVQAQTPEPKAEGRRWVWGDRMEQGEVALVRSGMREAGHGMNGLSVHRS